MVCWAEKQNGCHRKWTQLKKVCLILLSLKQWESFCHSGSCYQRNVFKNLHDQSNLQWPSRAKVPSGQPHFRKYLVGARKGVGRSHGAHRPMLGTARSVYTHQQLKTAPQKQLALDELLTTWGAQPWAEDHQFYIKTHTINSYRQRLK